VTLERMLTTPTTYFVAQQFFPQSLGKPEWRLYYSDRGGKWIANYRGHFFYLESRAGVDPPYLRDIETIVSHIEQLVLGDRESVRLRGVWHDTPNGAIYSVTADYLVPCAHLPTVSPSDMASQLPEDCVDGGWVTWNIKLQLTIPQSDYYSEDDPRYYDAFKTSLSEVFGTFGDLKRETSLGTWPHYRAPIIRTFNDQLIWQKSKELFGYKRNGDFEWIEREV